MSAASYVRLAQIVCVAISFSAALVGCSREHYRDQADQEVCELIHEKSTDPRWDLSGYRIDSVNIDQRSRFADVYDPVRPPMPPDDPASHQLMHYIDDKEHWEGWHQYGDIEELENPYWKEHLAEYATITSDGSVRLAVDDAVKIARINAPAYHQQLETLYFSALDVSSERFRYDVQFFGGNGNAFQHLGEERFGTESNLLSTTTGAQARRRFAAGGQLLVDFANSFTWEFFGANANTASSGLSFSLIQPLLRRAGREFELEQLTRAERSLLANLRAMQRYRQGFYASVAIGNNGGARGPGRVGGFGGGTGLSDFSGTGSGGFGGVGELTGFGGGFGGVGGGAAGGGDGAGFAGGGAGTVGGFIGLLQRLQEIRNTEESLNSQLRTLALLESNLEAGLIDIAQVDQFRQNIETERANLLSAQNTLANSLDGFKRGTLGMPPNVPVSLDDTMIEPFQLIDPSVIEVQNAIADYVTQFGELPPIPSSTQLNEAFSRVQQLGSQVASQFQLIPQDLKKLDEFLPERTPRMTDREIEELKSERARMDTEYAELRKRLEASATRLKELKEKLDPENAEATADGVVELLTELTNIIGELSLIQARARLEMISFEPIQLDENLAVEIARANRLDWMNNRASLVDAWRLIEFNANRLKSDFSIQFSGDMNTIDNDNPAKLRGQTGSLRASAQFDPPLTRLLERNNFRQQLIQYQQSKRGLIQFEDGVRGTIRQRLRSLEQLRVNLEIQRRAVAIAIRRVDQTREALNQPVPPAPPGQLPQAFGPTAAQNLLFALSDLRNTQNNLMSVWLNYHATRLVLYIDLGIMQVDENNLWVDVPIDQAMAAAATQVETPPDVPDQWFRALDEADPQLPPDTAPPADPEGDPANAPADDADGAGQAAEGSKLNSLLQRVGLASKKKPSKPFRAVPVVGPPARPIPRELNMSRVMQTGHRSSSSPATRSDAKTKPRQLPAAPSSQAVQHVEPVSRDQMPATRADIDRLIEAIREASQPQPRRAKKKRRRDDK